MISIKEKLEEYTKTNIQDFKNKLEDLEMLLSDAKEKSGGIYFTLYMSKTKEELSNIYNKTQKDYNFFKNNKIISPYGWEYIKDVCYLEDIIIKEFDKLMLKEFDKYNLKEYPKDKIFKHLNKLAYLKKEINYLEPTQKRINKDRVRKQQPTKEIIKVLNYIGDNNELTEPLVKLLYNMNGDFSNKLSCKQRNIYHTPTQKEQITPRLSIDRKKELQMQYKKEADNLLATIKEHSNKYVQFVQAEILNLLE